METITLLKKPKYEWENRLPFTKRSLAICKYLEGYAVKPISEWLHVSNTTIEYHLQKEGVYVKRRKPTMFIETNPLPSHDVVVKRVLTVAVVVPQDNKEYYFDEYGERYARPKSYAQLMRAARNRDRLRQAAQAEIEESKPKGFLLKVSLVTGNRIERTPEGAYRIYQSNGETEYYASNSAFSI